MGIYKPPAGYEQPVLPFLAPPPPADRDAEIRGIIYKMLAASRQPLTISQVMLSTAWVGLQPSATAEEVRVAIHLMSGDGTIKRLKGDTHMWCYSLPKGGGV